MKNVLKKYGHISDWNTRSVNICFNVFNSCNIRKEYKAVFN